MTTDVHTLSGAYALDALSEQEAAEFREHLAGCQACRDEVRELQAAAARMGAGEAMTPPAALRDRVLAAAGRTPQQPPAVTVLSTQRHRRRLAWLGGIAAALVLIAGGAIGVVVANHDDRPDLTAAAAEVFSANDARTVTVDTVNGGRLRVGVAPGEGEMAVDTRDLPRLDKEHAYQLWTIRDGEATSQGVLGAAPVGAAMPIPAGQTQVALTIEPKQGSERPTTEPIVTVDPADV